MGKVIVLLKWTARRLCEFNRNIGGLRSHWLKVQKFPFLVGTPGRAAAQSAGVVLQQDQLGF
jgi:hypothetical protein